MMASGSAEVRREERRVPSCHDGGCRVDAVTFCDETVVVLDRCTDGSRDIALRFTDRTIEGAWPVEGARRGPALRNPMAHYVDRNISDMIQRLDRYTSARALDLRDSGDIGSAFHNYRRIASRFWKCFVARKGYREGGLGFLIAVCAGLYPLLSYLKARYEDEIEETREP